MDTPDRTCAPVIGAGVGIRALSTIIDGVILAIIGGVIAAAFGYNISGSHTSGAYYLWSLIVGFCYYTYFESNNGATPGKMLCGLRVVKTDGTPCDVSAAAIRTVCRLVDGLFVYLVAAVLVWFSANNQRLGDMMAKTLVIRLKK